MITDFRLQVFKTVAGRLSFTRAAEELCISQPAVTKHIRELERQVGTPLFLRLRGRIVLTPKGVRLLDYVDRILGLYREASDEFAEKDMSFSGVLNIGASTTISQYLLPAILARFKKQYPNIRIVLYNGNTEQIESWVERGRLDIGLIEGDTNHASLHYTPFFRDEIVLVTTALNPRFDKDEIAVAEMPRLPLVLRENGSGTLAVVEHALSRHKITRKMLQIEIQLGSTEGIKRYLYHSDAFAFLSVASVTDELAADRLRVVEIDGLRIDRMFRFVSLHGTSNRLAELFSEFCYNYKL